MYGKWERVTGMYCLNTRQKEQIGILGTIFLSVVFFLIISNGNLNFGLFDDNQAQWLPVIDRAYQTLFGTGKLPTIDFFQMKGMKIYDQGYYGLWNPFMMAAYLLRTYLLFFLDTNTISVYIFMMILFGNLCCYGVFRKFEIPLVKAVLLSACMMSVSVYVALSYWYYVYNVYFILSWLLLRIIKQEDKRSYYEYGIILTLSLFMGNVQYTAYMLLAFVLIMFILFIQGNQSALGKLLSNSACMAALSLVPLLLLLQASSRTLNFSGNNAEYYSSAVHVPAMVLFSWFPSAFLGDRAKQVEGFFYSSVKLPDTGFFPGAQSMYMGVMVCAAVIFMFCKKNYKKDRLYATAAACMMTAGIFLLLSFGKTGLLAVFIGQVPFINSFRIMAKYFVLVPLLLVPCVAAVVREQKSFWNWHTIFILTFMLFGIMHNRQIAFGTPQIKADESVQRLEELGVDYHNYRVQGFASWQEIQVSYPQWEEFSQRERVSYEEKFSKNAGTVAGVLTQGGYDLAFDYKQYEMSSSMMGTMSGYASEFGYDNMVIEEYFMERYQRDSPEYWPDSEKLREQIIDNNVKYFIFTKDSVCLPIFLQLLADMHMFVEWQQDFLDHTMILAVADIPSLVQTKDGEKTDVCVTMDKIRFPTGGNQEFRVGMYYDEDLHAHYIGEDGNKTELQVLTDEKGYLIVSGIPDVGNGMVEIDYHNPLYIAGEIWNVAVLLLMVVLMLSPAAGIVERAVCRIGRRIKILAGYLAEVCPCKGVMCCFIVLLCAYAGFIGIYYLHTDCTVPDEDWFLQIFRTIHHKAEGDIFAYLGKTENYLGYGQIYWIIGGMCPYILPLRIMVYAMLMGSMFLTLQEIKCHYGKEMVPYAGILWIFMPYVWYVNKSIGPEIPGLFLGITGLQILRKERYSWAGWILLGISSAIKMNYAVFLLMALLKVMWCTKGNKTIPVIKGVLFGVFGFLIANPIILWDLHVFMENMALSGKMVPEAVSYVFERRACEWDGVVVNGVFWGYVSAFLFSAAMIIWIVKKTFCKRTDSTVLLRPGSDSYGNLAGGICLLLVLICCREVFLGWYLLPLCYLAEVFICSRFYYGGENRQIRNLLYWAYALCLIINGLKLMPEHISHRENNLAYMRMEADQDEIQKEIAGVKADLEQKEPDMRWYYLLEFHMGEYSYNFADYADFCVSDVEGIAVVGERMRCIAVIDEIIKKAVSAEDNLSVLWQKGDVWVVERRGS